MARSSSWPIAEARRSRTAEAHFDHLLWFTLRNDIPLPCPELLSRLYLETIS
jgi:hypothetical protein